MPKLTYSKFGEVPLVVLRTPSLVIDGRAMRANLEAMARWGDTKKVKLRPHIKTHKSSQIARMQTELGAIGLACATLDELDVMAKAGFDDLLLTSPVSCAAHLTQLRAVHGMIENLTCIVDDPLHADLLHEVSVGSDRKLNVLIDLDVGHNRTGVKTIDASLELARLISQKDGLALKGVQAFAGNVQHIESLAERRRAAVAVVDKVRSFTTQLGAAGFPIEVRSGSGTGTFDLDGDAGAFTEYQVGSYALMDVDYDAVRAETKTGFALSPALFVETTIISSHGDGVFIVDAGAKAIGLGVHRVKLVLAKEKDAEYEVCGDEHGRLTIKSGVMDLSVGDRLTLQPPHCDPTVGLYPWFVVVNGDKREIWPIDARRGMPIDPSSG